MTADAGDTIFALSSGQPPAGIAVVRISGPGAGEALRAIGGATDRPRMARLTQLSDPADGAPLDRALTLWLPGPRTATGEDIAELHLHGGRAVIAAVSAALGALPGLRVAEPGEFTRRAFENGAIDLAEAEGLADLLEAETESQRRNALALAGGAVARAVAAWRERLLMAGARIEATLDFADEDDVDDGAVDIAVAEAVDVRTDIVALLDRPPAERLRDGIRVVIAGPPNAGKSTLLNALVGRDAAIATPVAGTTRDVIEAPVMIEGVPLLITDTAGLHDATDAVEQIGIERAHAAIAGADMLLWLGPPAGAPTVAHALTVHAQSDVRGAAPEGSLAVSAVTGEGMSALMRSIVDRARSLLPVEGEVAFHRRQRIAMADIVDALAGIETISDEVIVAEQLRRARQAVDRVTNGAGVEDMLDSLFGRFCIGK